MLPHRDQFGFLAQEFFHLWEEYGVEPAFSAERLAAQLDRPAQRPLSWEGNPAARLCFLRDCAADPQAEQLLTKIIEAMKWRREDTCLLCVEDLQAGLWAHVTPRVVVALGERAVASLLPGTPLSGVRGKFRPAPWDGKIAVMPSLCPSVLLKNASAKKIFWEDMKLVVSYLEANP